MQRSTIGASQNSDCADCGGSGWFRLEVEFGHPQFGKLTRCTCKRSEDASRLQKLSGLTDAERSVRMVDVVAVGDGTKRMVQASKIFIENPVGYLTIHGTTGNAKTAVMHAIVNELIDKGIEAVYVTAFDVLGYIRAAFDAEKNIASASAYERLKKLECVRVLCIDELDKVRWTEFVEEQITDLVDARYRLGLDWEVGTVIAMNANPESLPAWIYSRLRDGRNVIVENMDADVRPGME